MPGYSDSDYAGLMKVADELASREARSAMEKAAIEWGQYGNMPDINPSSLMGEWGKRHPVIGMAADIGAYFTPAGNALAAYDATRNYTDMVSDLKRGKWLSAAGNFGSGVLNTLWAVPLVGNTGKILTRLGGGLIKGFGKGGSRVARAATRAGNSMARSGARLASAGRTLEATAPRLGGLATFGGFTAAGLATSTGDQMYEAKQESRRQGLRDSVDRMMASSQPYGGNYLPYSSLPWGRYQPNGPYGNPYGTYAS